MNELQPQKYREDPDACLDRGLLVGLRDGELTAQERERALAHLAVCPDCRADERSMQTDSQELYDLLTALGPSLEELPETETAFATLQSRLSGERRHEPSAAAVPATAGSTLRLVSSRKSRPRRRWWIAAAAAVLAAAADSAKRSRAGASISRIVPATNFSTGLDESAILPRRRRRRPAELRAA